MDYLAIATGCSDTAASVLRMTDLIGLRGRSLRMFQRGMMDAAFRDLQIAMDNADEAGLIWTRAEQLELFRTAAWCRRR